MFEIACTPDGRFPIHHPDPTVPENLELLIDKVKHEKADLGIAYDGDADRIGAVDEQGNILWGDELLVLFPRDVLQRNPKGQSSSQKSNARKGSTMISPSTVECRSCGRRVIPCSRRR